MILDTNALSAIAEGDPDAEKQFVRGVPLIPVIVLGEYWFGITMSRRRPEYQQWIEQMISACGYSTSTSIRLQLKQAGSPIPSNDIGVAALARQHEVPILSRDRHFDSVKAVRRIG